MSVSPRSNALVCTPAIALGRTIAFLPLEDEVADKPVAWASPRVAEVRVVDFGDDLEYARAGLVERELGERGP